MKLSHITLLLLLLQFTNAQAQTCSLVLSTQVSCAGNTVTFTVTSSGGTVSNIKLDYGDGNQNNNASAISVYSYNTAGTYIPTVTVTFAGGATCNASAPSIKINALPIASFVITSEDTLCFKGNNLCIRSLSQAGASGAPLQQLTWQLSNGYLLNDNTPTLNENYCYANNVDLLGHLYSMVVEVRDTNGCVSRMDKQDSVVLLPKHESPLFSVQVQYQCDSTTATYTNTSNIPTSIIKKFFWVFSDGKKDSVNWQTVKHTYSVTPSLPSRLIIIDLNNCADTFSSTPDLTVIKIDTVLRIDTVPTQCFRGNKYRFRNSSPLPAASVSWDIYNANDVRIYTEKDTVLKGYSFPNCGVFKVRMTVTLGSCVYVKDTFINVLGPNAIISNDTIRVINSNQCSIADTVFFISPNPYLSCHSGNQNMIRLWDFNDPFAPPCTTDTKNGMNAGVNCNWSRDSIDVKHMYSAGQEGCYFPSLYMKDLITGCEDSDTGTLSLTPPAAGYDTTVFPAQPRLVVSPDSPCFYTTTSFDIDRTLPNCGYEKAWINVDSACNQGKNWIPFDTILRPRGTGFGYSDVCDSSGWVTVGLIIKNGNCYDTAWYHHALRFYPKKPQFTYELLRISCNQYSVRLIPIDTIQLNMKQSVWSHGSSHYPPNYRGSWIVEAPFIFKIDTIHAGDSIIPTVLLDSVSLSSGIHVILNTLMDVNRCYSPGYGVNIAVGTHGLLTVPSRACVNQEIQLQDDIRYYSTASSASPSYLYPTSHWKDSTRANAGKERIWWDIGDGNGFSLTGSTPTISYSKGGVYTVKMAWSDSVGCMDTLVMNNYIHVTELHATIQTLSQTYFCAPQIIQFHDSSYIAVDSAGLPIGDGVVGWLWTYDDNKPSNVQQNPAHDFTSNGTFHVNLIVTSSIGCTDTASVTLDMKGPQPMFDILTDTIGCAPFTVEFDNTTQKKLLNWTWFWGDNNVTPTIDDSDKVHTYLLPGIYKIRLQGQDTVFNPATGNMLTCNAFFPDTNTNIPSRTVYVLPKASANITASDTFICPNQEIEFVVTADTLYYSFHWYFGDSDTTFTMRPDTITRHVYTSTGIYQVMMAPVPNTFEACIDTAYKTIFVSDIKADFDIDSLGSPDYIFKNKSSSNATRFVWDFGNPTATSNNAATKDAQHRYEVSKLDTFMVCMWAYNADDCMDSICKPVVLGARVNIPNVFTPDNNDGFNDAFDIDIEGWTLYDLVVYNRWGNVVFKGDKDGKDNDGVNWNGKRHNTGEPCPAGVYYFIFNYKLTTEIEAKSVAGTVTLIR